MTSCLLAFSAGYSHLKEIFRRTLETLEYEVEVFDHPDMEHAPPGHVQMAIERNDCVVILLGPTAQPSSQDGSYVPAPWPLQEAVHAHARGKPIALVLHRGTNVPEILSGLQTPARFDFWNYESLAANFHHILKQLLDLKRLVELPAGSQPFFYTQVNVRARVERGGVMCKEAYHEVIARQPCHFMHHAVGIGIDKTSVDVFESLSPDDYEVEVTTGRDLYSAQIRIEKIEGRTVYYYVDFTPPLREGAKVGYRRAFFTKNVFPLTATELRDRSSLEGFPEVFRADGRLYYGTDHDILFDIDTLRMEISLPRKVQIRSKRALVISYVSKNTNVTETERCNTAGHIEILEDGDSPYRTLALNVPKPLMNHTYLLMYEPGD